MRHQLYIDGRNYEVDVFRNVESENVVPRLLIVSRQQNDNATELVKICIAAIQKYTPEAHEIWVIDNNSSEQRVSWLENCKDINVALIRTDPRPPYAQDSEASDVSQLSYDSYANALALEAGIRLIDSSTKYVMSFHMDTMPCRSSWLSFLISKMKGNVRAAGVRMDKTRNPDGVLHVLGYLVDFQLFKELNLTYFPDLPTLDVGDRVTNVLRAHNYEVFACHNTLWEPELIERIPQDSPLRNFQVDRSFDDDWNVIFLHLGRGVRKSIGVLKKGTGVEDWIHLAYNELL